MRSRDAIALVVVLYLGGAASVRLPVCGASAPHNAATNAPPVSETTPAQDTEGEPVDTPSEEAPVADGESPAAESKPAESPYQSIVAKNAFRLRLPPPPAAPPEPTPQVTPSALKLTGITTLFGGKRAMFVVQEPNKPQLVSDLVRENEKDTIITNLEVLNIDEHAGVVRVVYGGKELSLNFQDNGLKAPMVAAAPVPGQPGQPGLVRPAGAPVPGARTTVGAAQPGVSGAVPATGLPSTIQPPSVVSSVSTRSSSGLRSLPTRPTRLTYGAGVPATPDDRAALTPGVAPSTVSPEERAENLRIQQELMRRYGLTIPTPPPPPGAEGMMDPAGGGPGPE